MPSTPPLTKRTIDLITITVNDQSVEIESPMSVKRLLETVEVPIHYLAVEVNGDVVPREAHGDKMVGAGDNVEVVTLVGGG